ncbi:MAG: hypothetical protein ABSG46_20260 [Candidatus Binataceae bacterium]|jgi:hypothetical protein
MARTILTPTLLTADSTAANLNTLATAGVAPGGTGAGNGVQFTNVPGQTFLLVQLGTTASTLTVNIGATLFGLAATAFSVGPLTVSTLSLLGPFHSALDQAGTSQVAVDFSSVTNVLCVVLQASGVY